jgi:hypothetical protein
MYLKVKLEVHPLNIKKSLPLCEQYLAFVVNAKRVKTEITVISKGCKILNDPLLYFSPLKQAMSF